MKRSKPHKDSALKFASIFVGAIIAVVGGLIILPVLHGCAATPTQVSAPEVPTAPVSAPAPVLGHGCADYSWKDRGRAPKAFFNGMVLSYRQAQCTSTIASGPISDRQCKSSSGKIYNCDALKTYNLGAGNELLKTYSFLIGLAQRESSGNFSEGLDTSSDKPWTADKTEAGAFQISWDGMNAHPELKEIYARYRAHPELCLKTEYSAGVSIRTGGYIGTGEGRDFQNFVRSCPGVQAPLAAVYVRVLANHFGPINTKKVEYNADCEAMLKANEVKCQ